MSLTANAFFFREKVHERQIHNDETLGFYTGFPREIILQIN